MTRFLLLALGLLAGPAIAHPGHIADLAGHGHVGGLILIGMAAAVGLWGALKGAKASRDEDDEVEENVSDIADEDEPQEA
jgi:hypothetical protein